MSRNAADLSDVEVAQVLRKSVRTVQRWCYRGDLPGAYKAGRSWRIPRASLPSPHLDANRRSERGPLGQLRHELWKTSELLKAAGIHIATADPQTVQLLLRDLDRLTAAVKVAGAQAQERRRRPR